MPLRLPRRAELMVLALVALAFALRVWNLAGQSLWRDEVDAIRFSLQGLDQLARLFVTPGHNGPLYYLLLRPWLQLAGDSEFALRFFSLGWGLVCLPLMYQVGRRLLSRRAALLAVLLAVGSPYLVWYSQEGKMYALVTALALGATWLWLEALARGGSTWRWLAYGALTASSVYVHFLAVLMVPIHILLAWRHREQWRPAALTLAGLGVLYVPLAVWQLPLLVEAAETGYPFVALGEMLAGLAQQYSLGVMPTQAVALLPFLALALAAFYPSRQTPARRGARWGGRAALLAAWLLLPAAALFLVSLRRPLFTERYLIFSLPAWLLLLAMGAQRVAHLSRPAAAVLVVALLALDARGLWLQATTPVKSDLRAASRYVWTHRRPAELILFQIPHARFGFDYYARRQPALPAREAPGGYRLWLPVVSLGRARSEQEPGFQGGYRWAEGPYTNHGQPPEQIARQMEGLTAGAGAVWLFETEPALWDARGLTRSWLDDNACLMEQEAFQGVSVFRYEFPLCQASAAVD